MPNLDVGSEIAGHRLEAIVGRGGMGVVYRARDLELDRIVALKLIAPEFAQSLDFRDRFKRESKLAAAIKHPNVISIYRAGVEDDQLFITMDYVEGTDLKRMIVVRGRLDPTHAADVVAQVASGLDAAHNRGLVHRDVKPANVLLEDAPGGQHAYLTDFGLTKHASSESQPLTRTGVIVGTTDYLAPEQLEGGPVDARADVYALGCVLYEALTGEVPYPREHDAARMWAHMSEAPPSVSEHAPHVPAALDDVVRRAMAKDRNDRFLSAAAMGEAVVAAAADPSLPPAGPGATKASARPVVGAGDTKASLATPEDSAAGGPPVAPPPDGRATSAPDVAEPAEAQPTAGRQARAPGRARCRSSPR